MEYEGSLYGKVGNKYIKLEETTTHIKTIRDEIERCYAEIADKEEIITTSFKAEITAKTCEWTRAFDNHFNISCVHETGERANGNFHGKEEGAKWEFKYCPYCGGEIVIR